MALEQRSAAVDENTGGRVEPSTCDDASSPRPNPFLPPRNEGDGSGDGPLELDDVDVRLVEAVHGMWLAIPEADRADLIALVNLDADLGGVMAGVRLAGPVAGAWEVLYAGRLIGTIDAQWLATGEAAS